MFLLFCELHHLFTILMDSIQYRVELVHFKLKRRNDEVLARMRYGFAGVNIFMYSLLVVLIIIFVVLERFSESSSVCILFIFLFSRVHNSHCLISFLIQPKCDSDTFLDDSTESSIRDARKGLSIFYQSVIIFMALSISFGFLVYSFILIRILYAYRLKGAYTLRVQRQFSSSTPSFCC